MRKTLLESECGTLFQLTHINELVFFVKKIDFLIQIKPNIAYPFYYISITPRPVFIWNMAYMLKFYFNTSTDHLITAPHIALSLNGLAIFESNTLPPTVIVHLTVPSPTPAAVNTTIVPDGILIEKEVHGRSTPFG